MKNNKDFVLKEKLSSKKIFLLENILNNLSSNLKEKQEKLNIPHEEKPREPTKKKDFKTEIESRYVKAQNHKYIFPKQIVVAENDNDSSLESLKTLGVYDLNLQNQKNQQNKSNKSTKKLMENIQRKKNLEDKKNDFCVALQKMKQSLEDKLRSQLLDKKVNNFLEENADNQNNDDNSHNASERLEYKSIQKIINPKNTGRTSFSNLHSNFNRSLQQNAQTLDNFFKKKTAPLKENTKKMHLLNFLETRKERQNYLAPNPIFSPKNNEKLTGKDEILNSIKQDNLSYRSMAKKLYRKMQDNVINNHNAKLLHEKYVLSFENPNSDLFRKCRNSTKLHNLTDRNKDSFITSTNKLNEVNDFFNKITKKSITVNKEKSLRQKTVLKKNIKGYSNNPSFNSSSSYSSQRILNTPINHY